ncbi:hypothetical protein OG394_12060 [Kribbella sp. NBC_01245]|uniref:DUF7674 family protein n=1 Tax=Kribbella sp. NBC_01245 TaxID=2903578 RepID=UPI002E2CC989|nr:hypothetical protein [Kribbella sp. NBC_01245]
MSAATVAAIGAVIDAHRELTPILDEHLVDNDGEVLPHLVMADIVRWLVDNRRSRPEVCRSVLDWLEREFIRGPDDVRGLITVSGVEMIPDPGQPGAELRELLGPELRRVDPWLA